MYKIVAIAMFSFTFFSAQGFGEELLKDKRLKCVMTEDRKNKIMGNLYTKSAMPLSLVPYYASYRFLFPKNANSKNWFWVKVALSPLWLTPAIVSSRLAYIIPHDIGHHYLEKASIIEDERNSRIKSKKD